MKNFELAEDTLRPFEHFLIASRMFAFQLCQFAALISQLQRQLLILLSAMIFSSINSFYHNTLYIINCFYSKLKKTYLNVLELFNNSKTLYYTFIFKKVKIKINCYYFWLVFSKLSYNLYLWVMISRGRCHNARSDTLVQTNTFTIKMSSFKTNYELFIYLKTKF